MKHYQPCFALILAFLRQTVLSNFFFLVILITTSTEKNNLKSSYNFFEGTEILLNKEHHYAWSFMSRKSYFIYNFSFLLKISHINNDFFITARTHAAMAKMKQQYAHLFLSLPL